MKISAQVVNRLDRHEIALTTNGNTHSITIPPRATGYGSSANGGELLFLALATCYCNDLYREATKHGLAVSEVRVDVDGEFEAEGEPGRDITYRVRVVADAPAEEIEALIRHTDTVAEIQNTLRKGVAVELVDVKTTGSPLRSE